jgi:hypothetical protein
MDTNGVENDASGKGETIGQYFSHHQALNEKYYLIFPLLLYSSFLIH